MSLSVKRDDNFFEISFEDNETNRLFNLCKDEKDTYGQDGNKDEIDDVLSHLVALDSARKENIITNGNIDTPHINFSIDYGLNGEKITENLSVPLGMGHFSKGINYLRENFNVDFAKDMASDKEKESLNNRLARFCSALSIPPKIPLDELESKGWETIDKMADLAKALPSEELASFLSGFQNAIKNNQQGSSKELGNEKFTQLLSNKLNIPISKAREILQEPQGENKENPNQVSQEKIEEIKRKSEEAIKTQKKVKTRKENEAHKIQA